MLSPSAAILISIAGALILLRLKLHSGYAIFAGSLILALLVMPPLSTPLFMWQTLSSYQTIRFLIITTSALTLGGLMEEKGLLADLATAMEKINPKLAVHFIPAIIGFVPMPAGALVSAMASRDLFRRMGLNPEQSNFINYWFRHLWEFSIPVYPSIIIVSVLLAVPFSYLMKVLFPVTVLTIMFGAVISYWILKNVPATKGKPAKNITIDFLKAAWPVILLVILVLSGVDAVIAFPLTLFLLALHQRVKWRELKKSLKYGLNPKMLLFLYGVMLYKMAVESSNAAHYFFSDMQSIGVPVLIMLAVLPFLIAFVTGSSTAFAAVAFPILMPFMVSDSEVNSYAILLAYVSGMIGLLVTPLHLCLIYTTEYFNSKLSKIYKYILPPYLMIEGIVILVYYVMG
ncbi:DUF401 family protein [Chloroflexota bacterium]